MKNINILDGNSPSTNYLMKLIKKIKAINFLGGKCSKCEENNIFKLIFHHKDPQEKKNKICDILVLSFSIILNEIKKM